jgi:hypothetical protein
MLINERDERLIQRCVDEELSVAQTYELLQRLDSLECGWKTLACGLLEDRRLRRSLRAPGLNEDSRLTPNAAGPEALPVVHSQSRARAVVRHWWSHPLTSLTLCAAIAFVGGMLIPDLSRQTKSVVSNQMPEAPGTSLQPRVQTAGYGTYQLQMTPGGQTLEVPVYSQVEELFRKDRHNPLFSGSGSGRGNGIHWMLVPVDGNRSMLIPVSEDTQLNMQ